MMAPQILAIEGPKAFEQSFNVSRETLEKLEIYSHLLTQWQRTINLVAPSTIPDLWQRHMADSAQLLALIPAHAKTIVDLGSGAGFPGLVLAILLGDRAVKVTLIESDQRKGAFLREVVRHTRTPVEILSIRIENTETHSRIRFAEVVTARALAPFDRLFAYVAPYFSPASLGLFLKGREVEGELQAARAQWEFDVELRPSCTSPEGAIAVIRHLQAKTKG